MGQLFQELKRRNIFRVGIAYLVLGWLILQVGAIVAPALSLPEWTLSFVIFVLLIGFPLVLIFAWAFELTPEGLKKTAEVGVDESMTANTGKKLNHVIIGILSLAVVALLVDRFFLPSKPATEVTQAESDATETPGVQRKDSYDSIAVLPFVNMSDDPQQEYFSDGISEELLNLLAKNRALRVAARTSSFAYKGKNQDIKEIGSELDVDTVLEGSVRNSGAKLRITAQLIETDTGYHLWSDTYDRELTDVFAIQDEISEAIVGALRIHLSGEEVSEIAKAQVTNIDAYNAYLKGRHNLEKREKDALYQALSEFDTAIQFDPNYAPAYSGKADAYILLSNRNYGDIPNPQANKLAEPAIGRALELDPNLADAHASNGLLQIQVNKPEEALASLNRAIELLPNFAQAYLWRGNAYGDLGYRTKSIEDFEIAHKLDPLSIPSMANLNREYLNDGRKEEAAKIREQLKKAAGEDSPSYLFAETFALMSEGRLADAFTKAQTYKEMTGARFVPPIVFSAWQLKNLDVAKREIPFSVMRFWFGYMSQDIELASQGLEEAKTREGFSDDFIALAEALLMDRDDPAALQQAAERIANIDESFEGQLFGSDPGTADVFQAVWIRKRAGDEEGAKRLIEKAREYYDLYESRGYGYDMDFFRIHFRLLENDINGIVTELRKLAEKHELFWIFDTHPDFQILHGNPEFNTLMDDLYVHINSERAKLGWEPVEREPPPSN